MSRIWNRLAAETGSILVEVVVGTVLLALTTAAVLDGLDGAQETGRKNKDRSTAATLAQQDLERLRSLPPTLLANLHQTRAVTVSGVTYTVASDAELVRDASGLVSCTTDAAQAEYLRLSSTVHSPASADAPVTETTLLTPPPGAFGDDTGTAVVKLTDRDGAALEGVDVELDGPGSHAAATNDVGCAVFAFIEAGQWTAVVDDGLVDWTGETPALSPVTVAAQKTSLTQIELDEPASLRATFATPTGAPARWTSIGVANGKLPNGYKTFPAGAMEAGKDVTNLFPFRDGYGVFAGSCEENNPGTAYFQTPGSGYVMLDPGDALEPVTVTMPVLRVAVTRSGSPVDAQVTVTQRDGSDCSALVYDTDAHGDPADAGTPGGDPDSIGGDGVVDIPLPFGRYRVCAAFNHAGGTWRRRVTSSSTDPDLRGLPPTTTALAMTIPTSGSSGRCP